MQRVVIAGLRPVPCNAIVGERKKQWCFIHLLHVSRDGPANKSSEPFYLIRADCCDFHSCLYIVVHALPLLIFSALLVLQRIVCYDYVRQRRVVSIHRRNLYARRVNAALKARKLCVRSDCLVDNLIKFCHCISSLRFVTITSGEACGLTGCHLGRMSASWGTMKPPKTDFRLCRVNQLNELERLRLAAGVVIHLAGQLCKAVVGAHADGDGAAVKVRLA